MSVTPRKRRVFDLPYLLLTLTMLFWSGNFIVGRAVNTAVPPIALAFWRWFGASTIVLLAGWRHVRRDWPTIQRSWRLMLVLAILGIASFNTLVYVGLHYTTAINGLLMQSTMPVLIVALSYGLFRERITPTQTLGVVLSLGGVLTIIGRGDVGVLAALSLNIGDVLILIAVLLYAGYSTLLRKRPALHPLSFLAATFVPGTLVIAPLYAAESALGHPMTIDWITLLAIGYVAVFPSILAYLCFNRGVELIGANRAGLFIHLLPVFGSLMAIAFLGETLRWFHAIGIGLIVGGIVLATRRSIASPANSEAANT